MNDTEAIELVEWVLKNVGEYHSSLGLQWDGSTMDAISDIIDARNGHPTAIRRVEQMRETL